MANIIYWPPIDAAGGLTGAQTILLADATTNTAPDVLVLQHTTSGTAAAGFGETGIAVELQSAGGTLRRVMTDVTTLTTATAASEVAARAIQLMSAGARTDVLLLAPGGSTGQSAIMSKFGVNCAAPFAQLHANLQNDTTPSLVSSWDNRHFFYGVGTASTAPGVGCSYQTSSSTVFLSALQPGVAWLNYTLQAVQFTFAASGTTNIFQCAAGAVSVLNARLYKAKGADVASATTLTLGNGNYFVITGTTTVKGITTAGWTSGSTVRLRLASGITINNVDGAPGGGAANITLRAGVNLLTTGVYVLALTYDSTTSTWYQDS